MPSRADATASSPTYLATDARPPRLRQLDSLRGLAALSVVLFHLAYLWKEEAFGSATTSRRIFQVIIQPFTAGQEAVFLFFILSGFVLSLPAIARRPQPYGVFLTRRIFRIYFPYLCAIALAVAGKSFLSALPTRSQLLPGYWNVPVQLSDVLKHVAFIGSYNTTRFDPPIWSLIEEMRVSIVFPALCFIVLALRPVRAFLLIAAISVAVDYLPTSLQGLNQLIGVLSLFVLGIVLAFYSDTIHALFTKLSAASTRLLLAFALFLYWYAARILLLGHPSLAKAHLAGSTIDNGATALGAAILIVLSVNWSPLSNLLLKRLPLWLGEMSYSLYLTHYIVLVFLVHLLDGRMNFGLLLFLCLLALIAFARAFYLVVERPIMNMGRNLTRTQV